MINNKELLDRIEELKHNEELLKNCISYLWEIWNNEDLDTILHNFKRLGFTDKDLDYWNISEEIEELKEEIKRINNVEEDTLF
jgi:hypothetical protein